LRRMIAEFFRAFRSENQDLLARLHVFAGLWSLVTFKS
jgi:hypothetical protein